MEAVVHINFSDKDISWHDRPLVDLMFSVPLVSLVPLVAMVPRVVNHLSLRLVPRHA